MSFRADLHRRAKELEATVVLAEGWDDRVAIAARRIEETRLARVILLDNPVTADQRIERVAELLMERRPDKATDEEHATQLARDPVRFAGGLVALGEADAAVAGATVRTADVLRAALWLIGPSAGIKTVSSCFYMVLDELSGHASSRSNGRPSVLSFTDSAVVLDPTDNELAEIAVSAVRDRRLVVADEPVVAFLSYSTKGSAEGPSVEKVRRAVALFRQMEPDVPCDGELQGDAALVPEVARRKTPDSPVAGQANILVFPDLDSGNIAYKLVQRLAGASAIGPIVQGLAKPMADLSRGATAEDIVDVAAVALLQSSRPR